MNKKYTYAFVKQKIEQMNGKLLSLTYENNKQHLDIKCNKCENIWHPIFGTVIKGNWCPKCAHLKYTYKFVNNLINEKNGRLITDKYENVLSILYVECCKCKNIWETTFSRILANNWCRKCYDINQKLSSEYVEKVINDNDGILLSKYDDVFEILSVQCNKCKFIWHPIFSNIQSGTWCPQCSSNKTEIKIKNIMKEIFPLYDIEYKYNNFNWLKTKNGGKQEIDIYIPNIKLAIEYDGQQHFKPVRFGGIDAHSALNKFENQKRLDKLKNRKMASHKKDIRYFIRIPYTEKITKENMLKILKEHNVPIKAGGRRK